MRYRIIRETYPTEDPKTNFMFIAQMKKSILHPWTDLVYGRTSFSQAKDDIRYHKSYRRAEREIIHIDDDK